MTIDVLIVLGSASDEQFLKNCSETLTELKISYRVRVASAHRSPDRLLRVLKEQQGASVIIAFAGHAAHLAGVIAAHVTVPVIAVPLPTSSLQGLDALLSSVQMPVGVPVAVMGIGRSGSANAAYLAAQILALKDEKLALRCKAHKKKLAENVEKSAKKVEGKP